MRSSTKKRGRPRQFDPDEVLTAALSVFRTQGFAATSLDDLASATGLNRPSLYASFGNKKAIYRKAMAHYYRALQRRLGGLLFAGEPLEVDLRNFYAAAFAEYQSPQHGAVGCSMICTATTEAVNDADIREDLSKALNRIDSAMRRRLRQAQATEYPLLEVQALTPLAGAILHSLAIRVRAEQSAFDAEAYIEHAVNGLIHLADPS